MFNSDRYLRDCCLSIVESIDTQDVTQLIVELDPDLLALDAESYDTKYIAQWRAVFRLLIKRKPMMRSMIFTIERCLQSLHVEYQWVLPVKASRLFIAIDGIDFFALDAMLKTKTQADSEYDYDKALADVRDVIFESLVKHGVMLNFKTVPKGKYIRQCDEALATLIGVVPELRKLRPEIIHSIRVMNLKHSWPAPILITDAFKVLSSIDFSNELSGLIEIDHGRGIKSWRFENLAFKRSLNQKLTRSFLDCGFIIPKDKKNGKI